MWEANNLLVGPISALFFAFPVSDSAAETGFDRRYSLAQEAFKRCQGAWLQSAREDALRDLADSGTSMALMLNPLSEKHGLRLEEVTEMLRTCTRIVYKK